MTDANRAHPRPSRSYRRSHPVASAVIVARSPHAGMLSLVEALPGRVIVLDRALHIVAANKAWRKAANFETREIVPTAALFESDWRCECSDRDIEVVREGLAQLAAGTRSGFAHQYVARSGPRRLVSLTASPFRWEQDLLLVCVRDQAESAANRRLERRHQIAILLAEEEERRRIARELHDETFQQLALIQFGLEAVRKTPRSAELEQACQGIENALGAVQHQVRTLSYVLHPPELDAGGLDAALGSFIKGFGRRSGLAVEFHNDLGHVKRAPDVEIALYRVAQEALANILKHARASNVVVRLKREAQALLLEICDDGIGIAVLPGEGVGEEVQTLGVGLSSMRERVEALAGRLQVSRLDPGTMVRARIPRRRHEDF